MEIRNVTLAYFSPTRTTKKVLDGIAETIGAENIEHIDLTGPEILSKDIPEIKEGLVILGAPVYAGRIPPEAEERFKKLKGNTIPAVVIAVYGNREYEDALVELRDIAVEQGFIPVAGGVFIGEHSFSSEKMPIAAGRPDTQDIEIARDLGQKIATKMKEIEKPADIGELSVPGNIPYRERVRHENIPPETDNKYCMKCQACVGACPTGAITFNGEVITNADSCILCCACVKYCPTGSRQMHNPMIERILERLLSRAVNERKEPELFL
ncbi:MAG: 4Fe-4S binding protein, partial [Dehalococcoidales bacterium]